MTVSW